MILTLVSNPLFVPSRKFRIFEEFNDISELGISSKHLYYYLVYSGDLFLESKDTFQYVCFNNFMRNILT